ncbi:hypothetical protein [Microbacterium deminutum]|uniref:N-acetyltransferase domain-containing protein n=1 Tax=Microbacterium deminutum TaxID=344164 RepID=A0ABN2RH56_9MICO
MQTEMSFLIDSNVVIAAEPFNGQLEELQPVVSTFLRIAGEHGHKVYVHPATLDDFKETADRVHREQNLAAYAKYPALHEVTVPQHVLEVFPTPRSPNDDRDSRILAALDIGAVHFLVTNDSKLRQRAARLGHESRVLRPDDAAAQLATWHPGAPPPPPSVEAVKTYELDARQPIFESLRDTYADFDGWIAKVKTESASRRAWVVRAADGRYEALAIVKMRDTHPVTVGKDAIKLSTFKVADFAAGRRLGELLLKAVLRWAAEEPGRPSELFVESTHERLLDFLPEFGFTMVGAKDATHLDEQAWVKVLDPPAGADLDGLAHHIAYGPPAIRAGQPIFVIPIIPKWYEDLFPDAEVFGPSGAIPLPGTDPEPRAHGNAIRKAYLCRSQTKSIPEGSTLLFYRSQGGRTGDGGVVAAGVAEMSHKSTDPIETIELSFKRTVYSEEDVADLHQDGTGVLTILFRHDRFIVPPWPREVLVAHKVVTTWPQSITRVRDQEGIAWVEHQLNAWP